jgi:hypothetical protein
MNRENASSDSSLVRIVRVGQDGSQKKAGAARNGCKAKAESFSWFSARENHSSRSSSGGQWLQWLK